MDLINLWFPSIAKGVGALPQNTCDGTMNATDA